MTTLGELVEGDRFENSVGEGTFTVVRKNGERVYLEWVMDSSPFVYGKQSYSSDAALSSDARMLTHPYVINEEISEPKSEESPNADFRAAQAWWRGLSAENIIEIHKFFTENP